MTSSATDLLERAQVLDGVAGLLDRAAAGTGAILVIAGAAGPGRTAVRQAGSGAVRLMEPARSACGSIDPTDLGTAEAERR
jgi:hypothetical protein